MIKGTFQRLKSFTDFIALLLRLNWLLLRRFQSFCWKVNYFDASFQCIIRYVSEYFFIFGKYNDEGFRWCMAFEKRNMSFWVNGPWVLVNFGTERNKFKMAFQNFDTPKKFFSIYPKSNKLVLNFSKF